LFNPILLILYAEGSGESCFSSFFLANDYFTLCEI
jgi:hypothetical protein